MFNFRVLEGSYEGLPRGPLPHQDPQVNGSVGRGGVMFSKSHSNSVEPSFFFLMNTMKDTFPNFLLIFSGSTISRGKLSCFSDSSSIQG